MSNNVLTTDFCPWANKYVYWLKEPIGWFVVALSVSVLVGMHVTPIGWVLASALSTIIVIGMAWPWIAVRAAKCTLHPALDEVHENQACDLVFAVNNRLLLPLWGLAIEGYLDREGDERRPTVALACVPPMSKADYRLPVNPRLRGRYPVTAPLVACSFPFGIWTARRPVSAYTPLTVFPELFLIQDEATLAGGRISDCGDGTRQGRSSDPLGVREFRNGDRLRNVHWVHTARTGNLMVCERGGPQQQTVEVVLDDSAIVAVGSGYRELNRNALAWRVRVAASLVTHLHARHIPVRLRIGTTMIQGAPGTAGWRRLMSELAEVPADGVRRASFTQPRLPSNGLMLVVSGDSDGRLVTVAKCSGESSSRGGMQDAASACLNIELNRCVAAQVLRFWWEVDHARIAA